MQHETGTNQTRMQPECRGVRGAMAIVRGLCAVGGLGSR